MQGWIKLHRCLMEKSIWIESTPEQKTILITLLMMANHQGKEWEWKGEKYKAEPGQFVTSLDSIVSKCGKGISMQNVRTALKRFEKYEFLTSEPTNKNRLITIVNWAFYQSTEGDANKQDNKQLTSNQQATNKQLTTNKNVKNVENDKKEHIPFKEIVDHLNEMTGKAFSHKTKNTRDMISARWNEGKRLEDFLTVIDYFSNKWQGVTFNNGQPAEKYLQPSTLFNGKFDERVNEAVSNQEPETRKLVPTEQERMEYRLNELDGVMSLGLGYYERINCSEEFHAAEREYEELERKLQSYKN